MMRTLFSRFAVGCGSAMIVAACHAQAFNIDVDIPFGRGAGPPSPKFGGAAGQTGQWNAIQLSGIPQHLRNTEGDLSDAVITMHHYPQDGGFSGDFDFEGNTGDYAKLLNDAEQVASILDGGGMIVTFSGLQPGAYELYTYAVNIIGEYFETPVYVPGSIGKQTQVVTGPMPGNSFQYLITHSIHLVQIEGGEDLEVQFYEPPNTGAQFVNGFQIVPVPEPSGFSIVIFGFLFVLLWRRRIL